MDAGVDGLLDQAVQPVADAVAAFIFFAVPIGGTEVPLIVIWLVLGGVFFTLFLRGINLTGFAHAVSVVRGKVHEANAVGEVSQFQALTTAVSGTVGIGNIAGVAVAISVGGPGATFWMIVAGLLGMSTKFAECTLAVKYRSIDSVSGEVSGGPMYYLQRGLAALGFARIGRGLAIFYAVSMVIGCLGIGNMFQSNQAAAIVINTTGGATSPFAGQAWLLGVAQALIVGLVIIGGIKSIGRVTARLVPFMVVLYVFSSLVVLLLNAQAIPAAVTSIVSGAFSADGITGGAIAAMIVGFRRAVFSNEAGLGSASIAHSASKVSHPASEGYVALLEPFIDTVLVCTLTALVIITTVYVPGAEGVNGIELTSAAFATTFSWAPIPLSICAVLFAFSTMLGWSYYGRKAFNFLFGTSRGATIGFNLFFLAFVVLGSSVELSSLIDLSDALVFVVAIPNLLGLYLLAPVVRQELVHYNAEVRQASF